MKHHKDLVQVGRRVDIYAERKYIVVKKLVTCGNIGIRENV